MTSHEIRNAFLDFFRSKGHKIVPSAPLVLKNDPTLMFTNSGMVQFKDYFLGNGTPPAPRIADTQKCLRVSGKHNDLEDVGFDGTHHTMFEMLGNWSFGDYFKEDAIAWSWELLTKVLGLQPDRLYATVFGGDEKEGLASDEEARDFWRKYLPVNHILDGSKKDNYWEMRARGPCGPCSEIHYDFRSDEDRAKIPGEKLVNQDDPSVVEIWNNVFMQFERKADSSLVPLPAKHVDTGMGFERLCMVLQGKRYTYDTDIFTPFITFIEKTSNKKYHGSYDRSALTDVAMRVVADHIRAVAFTIADGQLPASGGAGYVIRRILRRAVRYYYSFLEIKEPFLNKLVPLLADEFAEVFPELKAQQDFVQKVILEEERSFLRTLENGLKRLDSIAPLPSPLRREDEVSLLGGDERVTGIISGEDAFELFDTFGFPVDLTELIAREKGLSVDIKGFEKALQIQKNRSKADAEKQVGDWVAPLPSPQRGEAAAGKSSFGEDLGGLGAVEFVGYDELSIADAKVVKYRAVKDKKGMQYQIVLNKTPFYAESGGQMGDTGYMEFDGERIDVLDTKKENDLIIHIISKVPENIKVESVIAQVNATKRSATSKNPPATHLMHAAVHHILGKHAVQKGQNVDDERLRFDFSHFQAVTKDELAEIEHLVNQKIRENIQLEEVRNMPIEEARQTGAMMLFGEKYGENVRVITFDKDFSRELCGGTHVPATGEIGLFKIVSESAVAAGVRRIEAITADEAEAYINDKLNKLSTVEELLKHPKDVVQKVEDLQDENKRLQKQIEAMLLEQAASLQKELRAEFVQQDGFQLLVKRLPLSDANTVKTLAYNLEKEVGNAVIVFGTVSNDKPQLTIRISDDLVQAKGLNAGTLIRELAKEIKGGGGGQAFFATAGGSDVNGLDAALARVVQLI
ncbi:MAG: alanine--tRNA ligase [Saprospiraceae bacterium]|nr:alanine--tRNA ligase [Saprospiraceae bacterium]